MAYEEWMEFMRQSIESHNRQIGELTDAVRKFVDVTNQDAEAIRRLACIAERHKDRLDDPEGGRH